VGRRQLSCLMKIAQHEDHLDSFHTQVSHTHIHTEMPVSRRYRFTTLAREDMTARTEKLCLDYSKYKDVCRPQYKKTYKHQDDIYASLNTYCSPEYLQQRLVEAQVHLEHLETLADLYQEKNRLEHQLCTIPSSSPLIDRLSTPPPFYTPPEELPQGLKFRKTKITLREQEYWPLILATSKRLEQIKEYMEKREVPEKDRENVQELFSSFKNLEDTFGEKSDKFTNKTWRLIKRDLTAVKKIPFNSLDSRWGHVCAELAALGKQRRFVY
jgi:hypothetical protein